MINNGNSIIPGNNLHGKICGQAHKSYEDARYFERSMRTVLVIIKIVFLSNNNQQQSFLKKRKKARALVNLALCL